MCSLDGDSIQWGPWSHQHVLIGWGQYTMGSIFASTCAHWLGTVYNGVHGHINMCSLAGDYTMGSMVVSTCAHWLGTVYNGVHGCINMCSLAGHSIQWGPWSHQHVLIGWGQYTMGSMVASIYGHWLGMVYNEVHWSHRDVLVGWAWYTMRSMVA